MTKLKLRYGLDEEEYKGPTEYIYKITDRSNGKVYIGRTKDPDRRWREHRKLFGNDPRNRLLYEAKDPIFEIIDETKGDANQLEYYYIKKHRSFVDGYNMVMTNLNMVESALRAVAVFDLTDEEIDMIAARTP